MNFLDFLFPKTCLGCGKVGKYLCDTCIGKLEQPKLICPVCERNQPLGETHFHCRTGHTLGGLVYFYNYQGVIREAIHKLKYRHVTDLVLELENTILDKFDTLESVYTSILRRIEVSKPTVVPIPLFWYRENRRGFNQASLFGRAIAKHFNLPFNDEILIRTKPNVSQTKLSYRDREKNVEGVFSVFSQSLITDHCLLVDDVWTTGATMKEACRVLKEAGAREVWGIAIAR